MWWRVQANEIVAEPLLSVSRPSLVRLVTMTPRGLRRWHGWQRSPTLASIEYGVSNGALSKRPGVCHLDKRKTAPEFPLATMPRHERASTEQSGRKKTRADVAVRQVLREGRGHRRDATSLSLSEACVIHAFLVRASSRLRSNCLGKAQSTRAKPTPDR